jgi:hypothetical protein
MTLNEFPELSPEMCLKLKEMGFPQPTPAPNQAWYNPNGLPIWLYLTASGKIAAVTLWTYILYPIDQVGSEGMVFSPTIQQAAEWLKHQQ